MIYTVRAERTQRWWVLQCQEHPGAITQVARLEQADAIVEAIAFVAGVEKTDVEIKVVPTLPPAYAELEAEASRLRERAATAAEEARSARRAAALSLVESGMSLRDVGFVMGISHQRAQQLVS